MRRFFFEKSRRHYTFLGEELVVTPTLSLFMKIDGSLVVFNRSINKNNSIITGGVIEVLGKLIEEFVLVKKFGTDYERTRNFYTVFNTIFRLFPDDIEPSLYTISPELEVASNLSLSKPLFFFHRDGIKLHVFNGQQVDNFATVIEDETKFSTDRDYIIGAIIIDTDVLTAIKFRTDSNAISIKCFKDFTENDAKLLVDFYGFSGFYYYHFLEKTKLPTVSYNKLKNASASSKKHKTCAIDNGKSLTVNAIKLSELKTGLQTWQLFYLDDDSQEFLLVANNVVLKSQNRDYLSLFQKLDIPQHIRIKLLSSSGLLDCHLINFSFDELLKFDALSGISYKSFHFNDKECLIKADFLTSVIRSNNSGTLVTYELARFKANHFALIESVDGRLQNISVIGSSIDLLRKVVELESLPFSLAEIYDYVPTEYFSEL